MALTQDHKSTDPEEGRRIEANGGVVINGKLGGKHPILFSFETGTLAVSRAFGDKELKQYGLSPEPFIMETKLLPTDNILIIACDGVKNF